MSRFVTVTTSAVILVIMLFISWYEGSGIIEDSLSWGSSTPLTNQLGIDIQTGKRNCRCRLLLLFAQNESTVYDSRIPMRWCYPVHL